MLKERTLRIYTQEQLSKTVKTLEVIENRFIETIKAKRMVQAELITEKERSFVLEKDLSLALRKLEKEITARREAEAQRVIALREKRELETKLNEFTKAPKTIELGKIIVKAAPVLAGKLLVVNKEFDFVVVDLGRAHDLKLGEVLSIYRHGEFVGKVQVEKVEEDISAAAILPDWLNVEFKENDEVKKL